MSKKWKNFVNAVDPDILARVSEDLGEAMVGINISSLPKEDRLENRGV